MTVRVLDVTRDAPRQKPSWPMWVLVAAAALVAFLPSLWAGYIADDFVMLQTIHVLHLPLQAFTHNDIGGTAGQPYRPLWLLLDASVNRVTASPVLHHLVNLVLYAASSILVMLLAARLVRREVAVLTAVFFALYPRHTEAVAWINCSADLLACCLVLSCVALLGASSPRRWMLALGVAAGIAAPLAKESGFPVPGLAILMMAVVWPTDDQRTRRQRLVALLVLTAGVVGDLIVRTLVVHGVGNYVKHPFGVHRLVVVVASFLLATFSTSQMPVLQHPAILVVPALLGVLFLYGAWKTLRSGQRDRIHLLLLGVAWFILCLVPQYNNAVSLNTSNGERLLLLPSVGTAFAVAAVAEPLLRLPWGKWVMGAAAAVLVTLCLVGSEAYVTSGHIRATVVSSILRQAPQGKATVVVLNLPDSYRSARLLGAGLSNAVEAERPDLNVLVCAPNVVEDQGRLVPVRFSRGPGRELLAQSTTGLPFTTDESGAAVVSTGCTYSPAGGKIAIGLYTEMALQMTPPPAGKVYYLWFDGRETQRCTPSECAGLG